jgi:hypothetical protein
MAGNVFLMGARPSKHEPAPLVRPDFDPALRLREENGKWLLAIKADWGGEPAGPLVTSALLGKAAVPGQAFVHPDGAPYRLDRDYFGTLHTNGHPWPGPFASTPGGDHVIQVWPVARPQ